MGQSHGDTARKVTGTWRNVFNGQTAGVCYNIQDVGDWGMATGWKGALVGFDLSRVAPVGNKFAPRAWGSLACVYLGKPAS